MTVYFRQQVTSRFQLTSPIDPVGNFSRRAVAVAAAETAGGGGLSRETGGLVVNQ